MSAVLAGFGPAAAITSGREVARLLSTMAARGSELTSTWRSHEVLLAVARDGWEAEPGFAGAVLVATHGSISVICDATLYYTDDLKRRLAARGVLPESESTADLIAAAYRAFGVDCVDHLEGDYAFCVWDGARGSLFCARDPFGSRSLFYAAVGESVWVGSTTHVLRSVHGFTAEIDPVAILRCITMRYGDGTSTPWRGISELPAGHYLVASAAGVHTQQYWFAQGSERWRHLSATEAVDALVELLQGAVHERAVAGRTALALSGGLDSTAILATLAATTRGVPDLFSFKYPIGDENDESWYVTEAANSFGQPVSWIEISEIPFYDDVERRARLRSHCHGSFFEGHNRSLAVAARAREDRVLLNGHGGDNVLAVGDQRMADLLRQGRWSALYRYRRDRGYRGWRHFVDYCLRPALPFRLYDGLEPILGRKLCTRPDERPLPSWLRAGGDWIERVVEKDRRDYASRILRRHASVSDRHRAWALLECGQHRGCAASFDLNRDEGVELRMPFYDRRLVEFALSRPAGDFNQPNEYKVLLRRAMEGRLPARSRTLDDAGLKPGTAAGVMKSRWAGETMALLEELDRDPWIADRMGPVDRGEFFRAIREGDALHWWSAVDVSLTLFAEIWLRAHSSVDESSLQFFGRTVAHAPQARGGAVKCFERESPL